MTEDYVICTSCRKFVKYVVKDAEDCVTICDSKGKNHIISYTRKYACCADCGKEVYVQEIEDYNANEPIKQWHRQKGKTVIDFGDMTISQIIEICNKNEDCSNCPLLLLIKEDSPGMCTFNTRPWEWVPENPVILPEQKGESK